MSRDETARHEPARRTRRQAIGAAALLLAALAAAVAAYDLAIELGGKGADRRPAAAFEGSGRDAPAFSDTFRLSFWDQPRAVPALHFTDEESRALSLADFRGRAVVLNIWATWCIPCRKEMPTFDRLQAAFDKSELVVLPLSIDHQGVAVVRQFYKQLGLKALGLYVDPSGKAPSELAAVGLPTTLLLDRSGREVGRKIGPAEWDSPEMIALLRRHLGIPEKGRKGG